MGQLQHRARIVWRPATFTAVALALALGCAVSRGQRGDAAGEPAVTVRNLATPGAFEVEASGAAAELRYEVLVQRELNGVWTDVTTDLTLSDACGEPPAGGCVRVEPGHTLRPKPWNGMSCSSQCPAGCRANVYLGPGKFRFEVETCSRSRKYFGNPFTLGPYGKR